MGVEHAATGVREEARWLNEASSLPVRVDL
jgi:hypothetical protein